MKIQLLTNAALFTEEIIAQFAKYENLIVQVSLDGSSAESCSYQRGTDKTYGCVVNNIKRLTEYRVEVIVAMVLNKKNADDKKAKSMPLLKGVCSICKELPYCWGHVEQLHMQNMGILMHHIHSARNYMN
ncbi:MAG: hypothetical protein UFG06_04130 [Lachnospiraceae bacterium]|nr:hypothetical protein [Lachnospiraceae bacterium]